MVSTQSPRFETLGRWRSTLFLVAGGLLVAFAAALAVQELTATILPQNVAGSLGFAIGFLGLLGCYPAVVDDAPRLAAAGAILALLGAIGFSVSWVVAVVEATGRTVPDWLSVVNGPIVAGMTLGFLAFAIAVRRSDAGVERLPGLLALPAVLFAANVVRVQVLGAENLRLWVSVLVAAALALSYLWIGTTLRDGLASTTAGAQTPDSTA